MLELRCAVPGDVPALLLVLASARTQGPVGGPVDGTALSLALPALRVAVVGGDVVGYSFRAGPESVCVVDPAWQGQGLRLALSAT